MSSLDSPPSLQALIGPFLRTNASCGVRLTEAHTSEEIERLSAPSGEASQLHTPHGEDKATLSLCTIVKDEEEHLPECLESVKDAVDEMIVVDTGSRDETVTIARGYGARVFHHPWTADFSAARNYSLDCANCDWILCLDADERLLQQSIPPLRKLIQNPKAIAYSVRIVSPKGGDSSPCLTTAHRLFRNMPEIRFKGRVHEQIIHSLVSIGASVVLTDLTITHLGYAKSPEEMEEKHDRNLALLRMQIREEPTNAYAYFNLGQTLMLKGKPDRALKALNTALEIGGLPDDIESSIYNNLAECYFLFGKFSDCLRNCEISLRICPEQLIAHATAYKVHIARDDFRRAINELYAIYAFQNKLGANGERTTAVSAFVERAKLDYNLGICHTQLGQYTEAVVHLKRAIAPGPGNPGRLRLTQTQEKASKLLSFVLRRLSSGDPYSPVGAAPSVP